MYFFLPQLFLPSPEILSEKGQPALPFVGGLADSTVIATH